MKLRLIWEKRLVKKMEKKNMFLKIEVYFLKRVELIIEKRRYE